MGLDYDDWVSPQALFPIMHVLEIDEQWTRNGGVNFNGIIRSSVGIAKRFYYLPICGYILLLALITTMQRCSGVSNSKLDPRATCADEYDRCSTVNSISFRPLEVWFNVVALLAAYEGLDRGG